MKVSARSKRIVGHAIRILINTVAANFSIISGDERTGGVKNTSHSQNMNSKNNFGQCHVNNSQRARNISGSQNIDVYYKFFTVDRFKLLAVLIILVSACYHVILHLKNGHNTCKWLLTDGRFQGYNEWQPHGCMMHKYSKSDSCNCMKYVSYWGGRNHFVFVGDSRIRQLYLEFVGLLSKESIKSSKYRGKLSYIDAKSNVLVEFFWAPFVDNSMREILDFWTRSDSSPRLVVIGSALWTIKLNNGSEDVIPSFKNNITSMKSLFSKYKDSSEVVWMLQDHVVEARLFANKSMITNRQIDLYNKATIESLISSRVQIWSSSVLIGQGFLGRDFILKKDQKSNKEFSMVTTATNTAKKYDSVHLTLTHMSSVGDEFVEEEEEEEPGDGLHLPQEALGWDVQVLLNMICNNYMNFDDGSCCTAPENPTPLQMVLAVFFATSFIIAFTMMLCKHLAYLSRKVSSIKRNNRTISNGFSHFVTSHKNFSNKDHDIKDGREHVLCHGIHDMTSQMKRFPESCNLFVDSFTSFDSHHKCVDNTCDTQRMSIMYKDSVDFLNQSKSKQEFTGGTFHLMNCKKCQDNRCLGDATLKGDCEAQFDSHDAPLQFASSASPIQNGSSRASCEENQATDVYAIVCCISKLGIILSYFFVCDRTTFFMKENKYYTHVNFFLPFTYLMVLGLFFTEKTSQMEVLNRNQTDEWKGWMQIVILIYHLTGASKVLSIYMQIRVMASAYLFLSAYGHFTYFINKDDFSLHRLCTVIFRFNFLVALLCLAMNRPYQFYNFIPLVTFWFVIIFLVMMIPSRLSSLNGGNRLVAYWWLMIKIIVLIIFVTLLYSSEVLFDKIFLSYLLKPLFVSSDESIRDWRFRWSVDRYSYIYGLVFSLFLILIKKFVDDSKGSNLSSSRLITLASIAISSCSLLCYAVFTSLCQNKDQCNETHSYIAFIPILCYIILRNTLGCVRKKFSAFFAWFGKISLELFIAQYHIWLAADTHGILVLIPSYPVLNIIMTSFVFVCVAHELKKITNFLMPLFVPPSKFPLIRNILLVLVFTAIRHFLPF